MALIFPPTDASARTGFAGNRLDRRSEKRGDAAWVAALRARDDARVMLFTGDRAVMEVGEAGLVAWHGLDRIAAFGADPDEAPLLGFDGERPRFAAEIPLSPEDLSERGPLKAIDLRSLILQGVLPGETIAAAAQARSLLHWHGSHRFCSRCGTPSRLAQAGYRRDCPGCGAEHFPRTDPVVIMLTVDADRALLGRQARFPPGMYSALAGFVEPGETIEEAVRRETREEAGIEVGRVRYHASQPWPFPTTLMIGCHAEAETTTIVRDEVELEDCRWFDRDELTAMRQRRHPDGLSLPMPIAIARHLITAWLDA